MQILIYVPHLNLEIVVSHQYQITETFKKQPIGCFYTLKGSHGLFLIKIDILTGNIWYNN